METNQRYRCNCRRANYNGGVGGEHSKIGEGDVDAWWAVQVSFASSFLERPRYYGESR
jgi:hypothetical protein